MTIIKTALFAILILGNAPAFAQPQQEEQRTRPVLRKEITVTADIVRVGDFIEHAGRSADAAVFRAPDLGDTGSVPVHQVVEALRSKGFIGVDTGGATNVVVHRASRVISPQEIEALVSAAIAAQANIGDLKSLMVKFDRQPQPVHLDPAEDGELQLVHARYNAASQRFEVAFDLSARTTLQQAKFRYGGTAFESIPVAVLLRPVARGDAIRAGDIAIERKPRGQAGSGAIATIEDVAGLAARRPLRAGQPLRANDLMKPEVVRQNETVTITYDMPGLALTVRGKALETGAEGDVINVMNVQSKRTLQATISGPGRVTVASMAVRTVVEHSNEKTAALAARVVQQRTE